MKTLLIGKTWPEPNSSAAGRRTLDIFDFVQAQEWPLDFACVTKPTSFCLTSEELAERGISAHAIEVNDESFDQWIKELAPDLVIFDRFMTEEQFGWRVELNCPQAIRLLDTSDLHCLRHQREQAEKGKNVSLYSEAAVREISSIYRSDLTLMISNIEMQVLDQHFNIHDSLIHYLPFIFNQAESHIPSFTERQHFMFIGGFIHQPNVDAVLFLKKDIWPLIRKAIPNAEMHVYGGYTPHKIQQLQNKKERFYVKGRADDALETLKSYRINLSPLRFGAGLKGKIFEGFSTGTVNITTPIGIEGICTPKEALNTFGSETSIEANSIAQQAIALYQNEPHWQTAQQKGFELLNGFSSRQHYPALLEKLHAIKANLDNHRHQNFIGTMLRHHQHRSTEFMSRWIEAKNKG